MIAAALLTEFEALSNAQRLRRMRELGTRMETDSEAASIIVALEGGGFYERRLALHSCFASRDGAHVLRALSDPSHIIRGEAVVIAPLACDASQAVQGLQALGFKAQKSLLTRLVKWKRRDVFDAFLALLPADDERRLRLLPFGSAQTVQTELAAVQERMGDDDWRLLARSHPEIAFDSLQKRAEAATRLDPRLLVHADEAMPALSRHNSDAALLLVRTLLKHAPLSRVTLRDLIKLRPNEVAGLILEGDDPGGWLRFEKHIRAVDDDRILALAQSQSATLGQPQFWLLHITPQQRRQVFEALGLVWRDREGATLPSIVKLLPSETRIAEAQRCLRLPPLATRPDQQFRYASMLPWDDARAALEPFIRDPDPDLRAAALPALIEAARYERDRLPDALQLVRARGSEQDPIRRAMLTALAALPPSRWTSEHLEELDQILRDALDAADRSAATSAAAELLVIKVLPFHPDWAGPWFARLVRESGQIYCRSLDSHWYDADVQRLAPTLIPVFEAWNTRERRQDLLTAAQRFGRRLRVFHALAALLEEIVHDVLSEQRSVQALGLLSEHRHFRMHSMIPELVRKDASWITREPVYRYIHRRRQDLITPFLGQQTYKGRFATGKTRIALPLLSGFERWTPFQQEIFGRTVTNVAQDAERDVFARITAIGQLAALPGVAPTTLISLAARGEKSAIRDIALRALARRDSGDGVPVLTEALNDDRARIAIYALRAALREMPADRAFTILRSAPLEKVTVAKEIVRLTGEMESEEAYQTLLEFHGRDLHRDVRVSLLRAFWEHLERDATWPILQEAAISADPAIAGGVIRIPTHRLSAIAQERLTALIAALLAHPEPRIRLSVLARCVSLPLTDREQTLRPPLLALLGSALPDECAAAARAVFTTYGREDAPLIGAALGGIREDRRAFSMTFAVLIEWLTISRAFMSPAARSVIDTLSGDPMMTCFRVELGSHVLSGPEFAALLTNAANSNELHADALAAAERVIADASPYRHKDPVKRLEALEEILGRSSDERLRRLGLAALIALGGGLRGWDEALLSRLREYRADRSSLVASAAQFTLPAEEMGETPLIKSRAIALAKAQDLINQLRMGTSEQ
ncbi:MAG: hypothetical protein ABIY70_08170 [Capsulimonas sp.]|uniref:hypothetical protein n=1 Tax=Capsulimonas sp. TaxID=2494211 RepID=UPI0032633084